MDHPDPLREPPRVTWRGRLYVLVNRGTYYIRSSTTNAGRRGTKGLHVDVWEEANGRCVPRGFVCHHRDHNPFNNHPDNLTVITRREHAEHHPVRDLPKQQAHLQRVSAKAAAWHRSDAGREWHRQHALRQQAARQGVTKPCGWCGTPFPLSQGWRVACSKRCVRELRLKREETAPVTREQACTQCGGVFRATRNRSGTYKNICATCRPPRGPRRL